MLISIIIVLYVDITSDFLLSSIRLNVPFRLSRHYQLIPIVFHRSKFSPNVHGLQYFQSLNIFAFKNILFLSSKLYYKPAMIRILVCTWSLRYGDVAHSVGRAGTSVIGNVRKNQSLKLFGRLFGGFASSNHQDKICVVYISFHSFMTVCM